MKYYVAVKNEDTCAYIYIAMRKTFTLYEVKRHF